MLQWQIVHTCGHMSGSCKSHLACLAPFSPTLHAMIMRAQVHVPHAADCTPSQCSQAP
jgi:hypothetical protein